MRWEKATTSPVAQSELPSRQCMLLIQCCSWLLGAGQRDLSGVMVQGEWTCLPAHRRTSECCRCENSEGSNDADQLCMLKFEPSWELATQPDQTALVRCFVQLVGVSSHSHTTSSRPNVSKTTFIRLVRQRARALRRYSLIVRFESLAPCIS